MYCTDMNLRIPYKVGARNALTSQANISFSRAVVHRIIYAEVTLGVFVSRWSGVSPWTWPPATARDPSACRWSGSQEAAGRRPRAAGSMSATAIWPAIGKEPDALLYKISWLTHEQIKYGRSYLLCELLCSRINWLEKTTNCVVPNIVYTITYVHVE
jgi:hypothetical protein